MSKEGNYRILAFVACESQIVDRSGKISLINIFQEVAIHELPAHNSFWCYLSLTYLDDSEHQIKITFKESAVSPERQVFIHKFNQSANKRQHYFQRVDNQVQNYGPCFLYAYLDDEVIGEVPIHVTHF